MIIMKSQSNWQIQSIVHILHWSNLYDFLFFPFIQVGWWVWTVQWVAQPVPQALQAQPVPQVQSITNFPILLSKCVLDFHLFLSHSFQISNSCLISIVDTDLTLTIIHPFQWKQSTSLYLLKSKNLIVNLHDAFLNRTTQIRNQHT